MKLRNKKTGEIGTVKVEYQKFYVTTYRIYPYNTLAELFEEWEDYEEPKEHWAIDQFGEPINVSGLSRLQLEKLHRLGNDFPSENATMKAIEKLKAWKRLKDKGFRFEGWQDLEACDETEKLVANRIVDGENIVGFKMDDYHDCFKDLNICFGGEE